MGDVINSRSLTAQSETRDGGLAEAGQSCGSIENRRGEVWSLFSFPLDVVNLRIRWEGRILVFEILVEKPEQAGVDGKRGASAPGDLTPPGIVDTCGVVGASDLEEDSVG